jgi:hypothetical protein
MQQFFSLNTDYPISVVIEEEDVRVDAYTVSENTSSDGGVWITPQDPWGDNIEGKSILIPLDTLEAMIPFLHAVVCRQLNDRNTPKS